MTGLPDPLVDALRAFAAAPRILVALDFDGTLAPVVDDPARARAVPEAQDAVLRLAGMPGVRVALVSGRSLSSLIEVAEVPDRVLLVGSHGIELRLDEPGDAVALDAAELERVEVLREVLEDVASGIDRVWLEQKPAGFALHTRLASQADSRRAHLVAMEETRAELEGLTVRHGKNVLEFAVRSTTKGEAIEHLRRYTRADRVLYAGDDVTDEDAFAALLPGDVGVKSGAGPTVAAFRVAGPEEVAHAIARLAELRTDAHEH
ncbi:trehalose-phosphatase [Pseudolysinimonas kribbensis]|uniref:Trehalose 6-phosphate phosphatase n=1 Tax=Pseudolysinimonas kribbensis TaxID=433641 RepID=A0ABQ6K0M6_9MICO|nr:trehalose-phosphatase [Pseudolysinimonas kribbensis]GMA94166.1 trehalose 6-phosphate phosphatase [Pseudolysinimonas kribbensis]